MNSKFSARIAGLALTVIIALTLFSVPTLASEAEDDVPIEEIYLLYDIELFQGGNTDIIADFWNSELEQSFEGHNINSIAISTKDDFVAAWDSMGGFDNNGIQAEIPVVIMIFHSTPYSFEFKKTGEIMYSDEVAKLQGKNIDCLLNLGCNAGHLNYSNNLASAFASIDGIEKVVASDGLVFMWFGSSRISSAADCTGFIYDWDYFVNSPSKRNDVTTNYCYTASQNATILDPYGASRASKSNEGFILYEDGLRIRMNLTAASDSPISYSKLLKASRTMTVRDLTISHDIPTLIRQDACGKYDEITVNLFRLYGCGPTINPAPGYIQNSKGGLV